MIKSDFNGTWYTYISMFEIIIDMSIKNLVFWF